MSVQTIYERLRQGGLSEAGACGLMGNMQAESGMRADNAQDSYGRNDAEYTAAADAGLTDFTGDGVGYGLCQWTYAPRKRKLLDFARSRGVSVGSEEMQVEFCLKELREDYPGLYAFLCTCSAVYEAARRVCSEYERPAVANVAARAACASSFFSTLCSPDISKPAAEGGVTAIPAEGGTEVQEACWPPRELSRGMSGKDVSTLQSLLAAQGYMDAPGIFGTDTVHALLLFQKARALKADGIAGSKTWAALLDRGQAG